MSYGFAYWRSEWLLAGGPRADADTMGAVAMAESHGRLAEHNASDPYGGSWCAFQINGIHPFSPQALTHDPYYCALAAVYVRHIQGLKAWSTYRYGQYKAFLPSTHARGNVLIAGTRLHVKPKKVQVGVHTLHVRHHHAPQVAPDPLAALPWQFVGALGLLFAFNALRQIPRAFGVAMRQEVAIIRRASRRRKHVADAALRKRQMPRAQRRIALA